MKVYFTNKLCIYSFATAFLFDVIENNIKHYMIDFYIDIDIYIYIYIYIYIDVRFLCSSMLHLFDLYSER